MLYKTRKKIQLQLLFTIVHMGRWLWQATKSAVKLAKFASIALLLTRAARKEAGPASDGSQGKASAALPSPAAPQCLGESWRGEVSSPVITDTTVVSTSTRHTKGHVPGVALDNTHTARTPEPRSSDSALGKGTRVLTPSPGLCTSYGTSTL